MPEEVYWLRKKICKKCGKEKILLDFGANRKNTCKECLRKKPLINLRGYAGNSFGLNLRTGTGKRNETDC